MTENNLEQAKQTILTNAYYFFGTVDGYYIFDFNEEGRQLAYCLETFAGLEREKIAFRKQGNVIVDVNNEPIMDISGSSHKALEEEDLIVGMLYQHIKSGGVYRIVGISKHSETEEELVVYKSELDNQMWSRPKTMFMDGRFKRYYPKTTIDFMFVKVYRGNDFIVEGTYDEIIGWVQRNVVKTNKPLNFAYCEMELEKKGFRIIRTKHKLSKYYWE